MLLWELSPDGSHGFEDRTFIKLVEDIWQSSALAEFVSQFIYLASFRNAGQLSKASGVETGIQISHRMGCREQLWF